MSKRVSRPAALAIFMGALTAIVLAGPLSGRMTSSPVASRQAGSSGFYEARLTGAVAANLDGKVELGLVPGGSAFVTSLGADSKEGAILLTWRDGGRPAPGIYRIAADSGPSEIGVVVLTGSAAHPTGVFRAERGVVAIATASAGRIAGQFELRGRGFLAADPSREDREISVQGSFVAPGRQISSLGRWPWLLYPHPFAEKPASDDREVL
jgi:hypothetical protein